jgi:ELWxxDGT repeat protein
MSACRPIPLLHWILLRRILFFTTLLLPGLATAAPQRIQLAPVTLAETPYRPSNLLRAGDRFYFEASDPQHGVELWVSDGSEAGTRRLTDLCPGDCQAGISHQVVLGDRLYFISAAHGYTLYVVDGDRLSTVGLVGGPVERMVAAGDAVYLQIHLGGNRRSILRSRGEPGDLETFDVLCDGAADCTVFTRIESLDGHLFYLKNGAYQRVSASGAAQPLASAERAGLISRLGDRLLFWACGPNSDCAAYTSDGQAAGTTMVPGSDSLSNATRFQEWNGKIYWANEDRRLVFYDGVATTVTTSRADTPIGATPSHLYYVYYDTYPDHALYSLSAGGAVFFLHTFTHFDPEVVGVIGQSIFLARNSTSLHVSDGTPAGTRLLGDLVFPSFDSSAVIGDRLYAPAYRGTGGSASKELYSFDAAGNFERTLPPRVLPRSDGAEALANTGVIALDWQASDRFWRVDPQTLAATALPAPFPLDVLAASGDRLLVTDSDNHSAYYGLGPGGLAPLPIVDPAFFAAGKDGRFHWGESAVGEVLWESDGTAAGSRPLFDFSPGLVRPPCSYHCTPHHPSSLRVDGDKIYLVAAAEPGSSAAALWVYDRSAGQATRLMEILETPYTEQPYLVPVAGKMVFTLDSPAGTGSDVWVTDGTPAGTYLLDAYEPGRGDLSIFGTAGSRVFFRGDSSRLWSSDLAPGHLDLLLEQPGLSIPAYTGVAAVGDRFFFVAQTPELGLELWTSDGTPAGTRALDLRPGPFGSWPGSLLGVGERLVFAADRGTHGMELYQSDGTLEGTTLLADIAPGETPSSPSAIRAVGERIFFTADDGTTGRGLFSLDLPAPRPACPAGRLCLRDGRFEVTVTAQGQDLVHGSRVLASEESGVLSFFSPNNWELLVKVLDGCAMNQRFWVYTAAATDVPFTLNVVDRATGEQWEQRHPGGGPAPPKLDGNAFATCGEPAPSSAWSAILPEAPAAPRCADDLDAFCFGSGGRFRAKASWHTAGDAGVAKTAFAGSFDSGIFTFFSPSNWELMVKVLDGCAINGKHWVFVAATTDVGWDLEIEDQLTGQIRRYENVRGSARAAVNDSGAFACN